MEKIIDIIIYVTKKIYQYKSSRDIRFCVIANVFFGTYESRKMFCTFLIQCKMFSAKHITDNEGLIYGGLLWKKTVCLLE